MAKYIKASCLILKLQYIENPYTFKPKSLLSDYIKDGTLFEIDYDEGMALSFVNYAKDKVDALANVKNIRFHLESKHKISAETFIEPKILTIHTKIYELKFGNLPYKETPIDIFERFANLGNLITEKFQVLIAIKKTKNDSVETFQHALQKAYINDNIRKEHLKGLYQAVTNEHLFQMRFFIIPKFELNKQKTRLFKNNIIEAFQSVRNIINDKVELKSAPHLYHDIIKLKFRDPFIISPSFIDFHLEHDFPIMRKTQFPDDQYYTPTVTKKLTRLYNRRLINIGKYIKNDNITSDFLFDIDTIIKSMSIFGVTGTGKTAFLANLLYLIHEKAPNTGQLMFLFKNELETSKFKIDKIISFDTPGPVIPYIFGGDDGVKLDEIASYMAAGLGLIDAGRLHIKNYLATLNGKYNSNFGTVLEGILDYLGNPENQYGELQGDIFQHARQRILALKTSKRSRRFIEFMSANKLLSWVSEWYNNGLRVAIDLRKFDETEQKIITLAILKIIKTFVQALAKPSLKRMIIFDEAHRIFYKPHGELTDIDSKGQMAIEKVVSNIIKELRETGTGCIFADPDPHDLFDTIKMNVGTKVYFKLDKENTHTITSDEVLLKRIPKLEEYQCWVDSTPQNVCAMLQTRAPLYNGIKEQKEKKMEGIITRFVNWDSSESEKDKLTDDSHNFDLDTNSTIEEETNQNEENMEIDYTDTFILRNKFELTLKHNKYFEATIILAYSLIQFIKKFIGDTQNNDLSQLIVLAVEKLNIKSEAIRENFINKNKDYLALYAELKNKTREKPQDLNELKRIFYSIKDILMQFYAEIRFAYEEMNMNNSVIQ